MIRVLQLGDRDLSACMQVSPCAEWHYEPDLSEPPKEDFDIAILDREITKNEFVVLFCCLRAYTLFLTGNVSLVRHHLAAQLMIHKKGRHISQKELEVLLAQELPDYFSGSYGEKFKPHDLAIAQGFRGKVFWQGYEGATLEGDFGAELTQAAFWRSTLPMEENQAIDFWLEYAKDDTVEIMLEISIFSISFGTVPQTMQTLTFSEKQMENLVCVENPGKNGFLTAALRAKGKGRLRIIALHDRHSRRGKGAFLPGGGRRVSTDREEVFYYFDPGNLKPPLNVYFSGYRTQEGFEGYYMMRRMGHPFLLIADARLEGTGLYIGSDEYEKNIEWIIRDHMNELGFRRSQVILSGISGGTYGALYYGCRIRPHTILLGKPVANIGTLAQRERIERPAGFPASLDMLHKFGGSLDSWAVQRLDERFWNAFDQTEWDGTQFAAAYMIEDDYDATAYEMLQTHLKGTHVRIYGKGLHGRHNDNTSGIVGWFVKQYYKITEEHFDRAQK